MRLTFANQRNNKNCHSFLKALHEIERHNLKDVNRSIYMYVSMEELRLASSIQDIHRTTSSNNCLVTLKPEVYGLTFDQAQVRSMVFLIQTSKILKTINKNGKASSIQLLKTNQEPRVLLFFTTENCMSCQTYIEGQQIETQWPEQPLSEKENFYKVIKVCKFAETEIKSIDAKVQEELWIELTEEGMCLRTSQSRLRKEGKVTLPREKAEYHYMSTKSRLLGKRFINFDGTFFLSHLCRCVQKKRNANFYIKNIYDRYQEDRIQRSYVILETNTQFGVIYKLITCYITDQMNLLRVEAMQQETATRERQQPKEFHLLKSEDNTQHIRNLVLNRFNQVDGEAMIAQEIFKERKPMGKIEEGEETFTRKFNSRY